MSAAQLVDAAAIDPKALSDLSCTHEIFNIHLSTHTPTVPRGSDDEC